MKEDQFLGLVARFQDGDLEGEEREALVADLVDDDQRRQEFVELCRMHLMLGALLPGKRATSLQERVHLLQDHSRPSRRQELIRRVRSESRPHRRVGRSWWAGGGVLAAAAAVLLAFWFGQDAPIRDGRVLASSGVVEISLENGWQRLGADDRLPPVIDLRLGEAAKAELQFADGSRVMVTGPTRAQLTDLEATNRRIDLHHGELRCLVEEQDPATPFLLTSPQTVVTVRGTDLAVRADEVMSVCEVFHGAVDVHRIGGDEQRVVAGARMLVTDPLTAGAMLNRLIARGPRLGQEGQRNFYDRAVPWQRWSGTDWQRADSDARVSSTVAAELDLLSHPGFPLPVPDSQEWVIQATVEGRVEGDGVTLIDSPGVAWIGSHEQQAAEPLAPGLCRIRLHYRESERTRIARAGEVLINVQIGGRVVVRNGFLVWDGRALWIAGDSLDDVMIVHDLQARWSPL